MPYYDTPQAADRINATQPLIQANFATINTDFSVDHIGFDAAAHNGKHKKITFVQQAGVPVFAANEIGLYNIASALCLYNSYTAVTVPLTTKTYVPGGNANYYYLPSGLLVKFGKATTGGAGSITVNLNAIAVPYTSVPHILVTPIEAAPNLYRAAQIRGIVANQFIIDTLDFVGHAAANTEVYWQAIGVY